MSDRRLDIGVYGARGIPSTYSGYETFLTAVLPEIVRRGHKVTMYCRETEFDSQPDEYRGVALRYGRAARGKNFSTLSHGLTAGVAAARSRHDVLLIVNVANCPFAALNRVLGTPAVLNVDGQEWLRGKWGAFARVFFTLCAASSRFAANGVVTDCRAMSNIYRTQFKTESTVIPYCWTELEPAPTPELDAYLGTVGFRASGGGLAKPYVLHAGRLNPENNAVQVARSFASTAVDGHLLILGSANYASPVVDELRKLASSDERIVLLGHVADRRIFAGLVQNASIYVHAHTVGGINPALLEAMGVGAAILAFDTEFNREALAECGHYFRSFGDELGNGIERLLGHPEFFADLRDRAKRRVRERFGLEEITDAYVEILRRAADSGRRRHVAIQTTWSSDEFAEH